MKIIITELQYKHLLNEGFNFDLEYKRLYPKIFKDVCLRYANGDVERANDYCQLGFIKVHQKIHMYDNIGSLEGWVKRTIKNTILDELRKENRSPKRKEVDFDFHDFDIEDPSEEEPLFSSSDIKDAIETLTPSYKRIFNMYYFDNMTHQEIADELGISDGTSKSNLFKAKSNVKSYLEKLNKKRED